MRYWKGRRLETHREEGDGKLKTTRGSPSEPSDRAGPCGHLDFYSGIQSCKRIHPSIHNFLHKSYISVVLGHQAFKHLF